MKQIEQQELEKILNLEFQAQKYCGTNAVLAWVCAVICTVATVLTVQIEICFAVFIFCVVILVLVGIYFTALYINACIRYKRLRNNKVCFIWGVCESKEPFISFKSGGGWLSVASEQSSYRIEVDNKTYMAAQVGTPLWIVDFGVIGMITKKKCYFPQMWNTMAQD